MDNFFYFYLLSKFYYLIDLVKKNINLNIEYMCRSFMFSNLLFSYFKKEKRLLLLMNMFLFRKS